MSTENQEDFDSRQELDWEPELRVAEEVPEGHFIFMQVVWLHLMGKVEEKSFYFSHSQLPMQNDIYNAIFAQRPDYKAYKNCLQLYGEPRIVDRAMIPKGQGILSHIEWEQEDATKFEEIKL